MDGHFWATTIQVEDTSRDLRLDPDNVAQGYFKHAVYNHRDPDEDIPESDIQRDREKLQCRIEIITDADAEIPEVDELVTIEDSPDVTAGDD